MISNEPIEILLVEDNPSDAKLTMKALAKHNLANKVHLVQDGEAAINFIFSKGEYAELDTIKRIKLILLDLKLPKVDGLEVLKIIKSEDDTKMIPVVILTSSQEENDIVRSYKLGVNSYIVKPLDFDQFTSSVAELGFYWLLLNEPLNR